MGLTKQYLRYESAGLFNVIGSAKCNVAFVELRQTSGRYLAVGACQNIFIWDIRKGEKVMVLSAGDSQVCILRPSPDGKHLAAGYQDGAIRIFSLQTTECAITFEGHKSAITCLAYDRDGVRLVSGSKDTEIVVWDVINESGMFRLRGHKGIVTQCRFLRDRNILVSSSKDTFVKFWDLDIQHCFKTMVGHRGEVWDFVLGEGDGRLVTGAADSELRFWDLKFREDNDEDGARPKKSKSSQLEDDDAPEDAEAEDDDENDILSCVKSGSILRQGRSHVSSLQLNAANSLLACHGNSDVLELIAFLPEAVVKKRLAKRQRKARKKLLTTQTESGAAVDNSEVPVEQSISVETKRLTSIKASAKIKAFDFVLENGILARFALLLSNNSVEIYEFRMEEEAATDIKMRNKVVLPGHRSDVRTLSFSSDNTAVLSASGECMKIWNRMTMQCIRTIACDYALCSMFVPGDRHCVIGTKCGQLQIFDIASNVRLESVDAHRGALWSICPSPDQRGFVSGGADKEVKFWEFELIADSKYSDKSKRLSVIHTRTLQLSEDVLCVKLSQDGRLLAVSLLDSTVKVFFVDTLKFFLSLYGHKFPVLCMDLSDDSALIATGSADRNVKIWGLDFGDCHRSIFAHDDSIMCLQFIPRTHMFFTGGKDGAVKQWDADNFEKILTLKGHHGEVWSLAISPNGQHLATSSHDKSIRLWEKSEEILVLDEERETEREEEFEQSLASGEETVIPGETNTEAGMASKKTVETVKAAEKIMESVDIYREEMNKLREHEYECKASRRKMAPPPPHPLMEAYKTPTPAHFVLHVLKQIKSSDLEEALLVLPFSYVMEFLNIIHVFLEHSWSIELSCRCLFFLLRVHHGEITANRVLLPIIDNLRTTAEKRVNEMRDAIGFNMAGLQFLQQEFETKEEVQLFMDATKKVADKKKKRKKKEITLQRAILTI